jgi:GT2 family glycosyltransferase
MNEEGRVVPAADGSARSGSGGTVAVVLNYRTAATTVAAVRSLEQCDAQIAGVIVVDNASGDGSSDVFHRELAGVRLIVSPTNVGFSAGCNLGIREALAICASRILLLNSDAIVPSDSLGALEAALDADAGLGLVGPIIVDLDDPDRVQSLGIRWSAATGRIRHEGHGTRRSTLGPFDRLEVDGLAGCAMLIRSEVFEGVGLLDEAFFFGFEDLEFCQRARDGGWRSACIGTAAVLHAGSASAGRSSARRTYFAVRNHLLLARRRVSDRPPWARWTQTPGIVGLNLAHTLVQSDVPRWRALGAFIHGLRDHLAGRYGPG